MVFEKVHGLGNDFILFEDDGLERDWNALAKRLCERGLSVGADGILVVLPSGKADIRMRIINADGSEAEMCGNGIRCFAKYVYERGIVKNKDMTVETLAGVMKPKLIVRDGAVTDVSVDMGAPGFDRSCIPMKGEGEAADVEIEVAGRRLTVTSLLMGVPHTIVPVDEIDEEEVRRLGPAIEKHPLYPRKTNVNFVQVIDRDNIRVRTWERGAALTLACGTGACASVVAMFRKGLINRKTAVHLKAGQLVVEYLTDGRVLMTGPAQRVYRANLIEV